MRGCAFTHSNSGILRHAKATRLLLRDYAARGYTRRERGFAIWEQLRLHRYFGRIGASTRSPKFCSLFSLLTYIVLVSDNIFCFHIPVTLGPHAPRASSLPPTHPTVRGAAPVTSDVRCSLVLLKRSCGLRLSVSPERDLRPPWTLPSEGGLNVEGPRALLGMKSCKRAQAPILPKTHLC